MSEHLPSIESQSSPSPTAPRSLLVPVLVVIQLVATLGAMAYLIMQHERSMQQLTAQIKHLASPQQSPLTDAQTAALESIPSLRDALGKITSDQASQLEAQTAANTQKHEEILSKIEALKTAIESQKSAQKTDGNTRAYGQYMALKAAIQKGAPFADAFASLQQVMDISYPSKSFADAAKQGISNAELLREQLQDIVQQEEVSLASETTQKPRSFVARLNRQFEGMLHITKRTPTAGDFTQLRHDLKAKADIDTLLAEVNALPQNAKTPFNDWRDAAELHLQAHALLQRIEARFLSQSDAP